MRRMEPLCGRHIAIGVRTACLELDAGINKPADGGTRERESEAADCGGPPPT